MALRQCDATAAYARRLSQRDLYKRAVWAEWQAVPDEVLAADHDAVGAMEQAIADEANVDSDAVVLDIPPEPSMTESSSRVLVNGGVRRLGEQSTLVNAIRAAQRDQWRLGVYAPDAESERVGAAAIASWDSTSTGLGFGTYGRVSMRPSMSLTERTRRTGSVILEGTILTWRLFKAVEGRVVVEDGEITAVEETAVDSDDIVSPAFVNAHTHIGDSIAKEAGAGLSLDELVAPPDGLKHRLLRAASPQRRSPRWSGRFVLEQAGTGHSSSSGKAVSRASARYRTRCPTHRLRASFSGARRLTRWNWATGSARAGQRQ